MKRKARYACAFVITGLCVYAGALFGSVVIGGILGFCMADLMTDVIADFMTHEGGVV